MNLTRRDTLLMMTATGALCAVGPAIAKEGDLHDIAKLMSPAGGVADHILGSETAPVTVIEYASPTCPHCAAFHNNVFHAFKEQYVDSGKVKFILRPFLRDGEALILDAVVFMVANAGAPDQYHDIVAAYFAGQEKWMASTDRKADMQAIAAQFGFTPESFDAALTNQTLFEGMAAMRTQALDDFKLEGTPTFYVNGKQLTGDKTLEQLAAEIDPLVPADFKPIEPSADAAPATDAPAEPNAMAAEPVAPAEPNAMSAEPVVPAEPNAMAAEPVVPAEPNAMAAEPVTPAP